MVCLLQQSSFPLLEVNCFVFCDSGPPGQVTAVAGKKAGAKQGELGGILKELGYTEDQVNSLSYCLLGDPWLILF